MGLFDTHRGDLTDLSGRALVFTLPLARTLLLLAVVDGVPRRRCPDLQAARRDAIRV